MAESAGGGWLSRAQPAWEHVKGKLKKGRMVAERESDHTSASSGNKAHSRDSPNASCGELLLS